METYRGDDFYFDIGANYEDGSLFEFGIGDVVKVGIKDRLSNTNYVLFKEVKIDKITDTVSIYFASEEMKKCSEGEKVIEVELTQANGIVTTIYQDKLTIKGDVIR